VIGRRHSISGHSHQLNYGGCSPDFSTSNTVEKPLSSTIEQMAGNLESLDRSASSKQRSKALSFGDLSKKVFDLSCSNSSPAVVEKSSGNVGQRNHQGAESKGVTDLDARQESHSHVPAATPTRKCGIPEFLEDDNSKTPENGRCLGMSPSHYLLQCTSPNSSNWCKNEGFVHASIRFYVGLSRSCLTLCFLLKVFM